MKKLQVSGRARLLLLSLAVSAPAVLAGCGLGQLMSAPWIPDADNDNVVFLGDSIFALSGDIQKAIHIEAGGTFRNYTTSGAELEGGVITPSIRGQFELAESANPNSRIVVMDGGGNDILIPTIALADPYDCKTQWYEFGRLSQSCRDYIDDIYVDGADLLNDMAASGVTDIVYLGYYYTKAGLLGADDLDEAVDYGDQILATACSNSVVDCSFVDPRPVVTNADVKSDGVHPTTSGSNKIAGLIWAELEPRL
ncbi:SGNH/GDSL hydrolase family protein [Pyxidicoccus fallax]|uniref:SGNH/GDSL hydrolase family protein n=1 Tax=Pyxidicoccus fallax TaxID=394095 RepID=A0A848L4F7_9BACT|nr:SGNH/GDSL hydrolase family protein [Pyxidicoccus fallax]NMO13539.1 SGNH/GDSL hydrolase family protein [Pyxidicoccus fallax]NPC76753.1 SGNH/GDSL hydrolase family protein [Pyxidicoccus fallax]